MAPSSNTTKGSPKQTPPASFVKLAMRNMVRKGNQSLVHFFLTAFGLGGFLLVIAWFGRPTLPH